MFSEGFQLLVSDRQITTGHKRETFCIPWTGISTAISSPRTSKKGNHGKQGWGELQKPSNSALALGRDQAMDLCISSEGYLAFCYRQSRAEVTCSVSSHKTQPQNTADPASLAGYRESIGAFPLMEEKAPQLSTTASPQLSP